MYWNCSWTETTMTNWIPCHLCKTNDRIAKNSGRWHTITWNQLFKPALLKLCVPGVRVFLVHGLRPWTMVNISGGIKRRWPLSCACVAKQADQIDCRSVEMTWMVLRVCGGRNGIPNLGGCPLRHPSVDPRSGIVLQTRWSGTAENVSWTDCLIFYVRKATTICQTGWPLPWASRHCGTISFRVQTNVSPRIGKTGGMTFKFQAVTTSCRTHRRNASLKAIDSGRQTERHYEKKSIAKMWTAWSPWRLMYLQNSMGWSWRKTGDTQSRNGQYGWTTKRRYTMHYPLLTTGLSTTAILTYTKGNGIMYHIPRLCSLEGDSIPEN